MNTFCPYCQAIYRKGDKHECKGRLKARIAKLEEALLPFTNIKEKADYSMGVIKQSDIENARRVLEVEKR